LWLRVRMIVVKGADNRVGIRTIVVQGTDNRGAQSVWARGIVRPAQAGPLKGQSGHGYSQMAWYPPQHGISHSMVSRTEWYATRHGIPSHSMVSHTACHWHLMRMRSRTAWLAHMASRTAWYPARHEMQHSREPHSRPAARCARLPVALVAPAPLRVSPVPVQMWME
jgi:hypothetical protein